MRVIGLLFGMAFMVGCTPAPNDGDKLNNPASPDAAPFYQIDRNARGPLTMKELKVSIPHELNILYTDEMRTCFLATIEDLAASAGDPETLEPSSVRLLADDGSWPLQSRFNRRNLLAQAIISEAAVVC
ncbi:MAG: hypothetical protein AAFR20_10335 [Pseudomonadota bacterium]